MEPSEILMCMAIETVVQLTHQCKTEQEIDSDEYFVIVAFLGNYEQVCVKNQFGRGYIINVNQLIPRKK